MLCGVGGTEAAPEARRPGTAHAAYCRVQHAGARRSAACFRAQSGDNPRHSEWALPAGHASRGDGPGGGESVHGEHAALGATGPLLPVYFLAISGDDGAFGAGLLCRWYGSGTIPTFKLVTGVRAGSMIAPFAGLGGSYNNHLRTMIRL
jgi:hypothetical protein